MKKELHNEQEYYSPTIYRAGAAEYQLLLVVYSVIVYCYCVSHNLELIFGHPALPLNNNVPQKSRVALLSSIIDDKSATLDFRGKLLFKGRAGCPKINSRL